MQMYEDWIRLKMWLEKRLDAPKLVAPDGKDLETKRELSEDDVFFQVLDVGPKVQHVKIGSIVAASFMSGDMYRMQLPGEDFKSFATHEQSIIGMIRKQP